MKARRTASAQLAAARKLLSDARLIAFFRAAGVEERPIAIRSINRDLDAHITLDAFAARFGPRTDRPTRMNLDLQVVRLSPRVFKITFGFRGEVGDGGVWRVTFSAGTRVLRWEQIGRWHH
jgi:hypothetical protein